LNRLFVRITPSLLFGKSTEILSLSVAGYSALHLCRINERVLTYSERRAYG
jgi:hypothetical protein